MVKGRASDEMQRQDGATQARMHGLFFRRQAAAMTRGRRGGGFFWTWSARSERWGLLELLQSGAVQPAWWSAPSNAP
jgi:hypothetical protein